MSISLRSRWGKAAAATAVLAVAVGLSACTPTPHADAPDDSVSEQILAPRGVIDNAFQLGTGGVVVDLFTDASCPYCKRFDLAASHELQARIDADEITLRLHPMNYVSGKHGDATEFSTRVMNLLAAIADSGQLARVPAVYSAVLAAQPADEAAPLPDNHRLLAIAESAGAQIPDPVREAVVAGRWNSWVQQANDAAIGREIGSTGVVLQYVPTVLVGGRQVGIREDGTDLQRLQEAISTAR
ncbi:DsbA family protein [Gryllotalpicola koreensis]|uniref:Thioredoxin-like fold domain-containing protein n=1 Tax=Gryllotalpicola koreensis TaxID=993086 RepID=A0ABP8ABW5_9MICO